MRHKVLNAELWVVTIVMTALATAPANAQSVWQKVKQNVLQQQCQQGNQQACQTIAKQKQGQQPPSQTTSPQAQQTQQTKPVAASVPAPGAAPQAANVQAAQAWTPGTDAAASKPAGPLDPMKLPDIQGIHPGMTIEQVSQVLAHLAPATKLIWYNQPMTLPHSTVPVGNVKASGAVEVPYDFVDLGGNDKAPKLQVVVQATKPPNQEHIWHIGLRAQHQHIDRAVLVAALRKKYGKEVAATDQHGDPTTNETQIENLWWVYDEQGRLQSSTSSIVNGTPNGCHVPDAITTPYFNYSGDPAGSSNPQGVGSNPACMWIGVHATIPPNLSIVDYYRLILWHAALSVRDDKVTDAWLNTELEKARATSTQKAKEAKPSL
jgi:hypothetical protein